MLERLFHRGMEAQVAEDGEGRLPPGQKRASKFRIVTTGSTPKIHLPTWRFSLHGLVEHPLEFSLDQFMAQPQVTQVADFHCIMGWSTLDSRWEGVKLLHLLAQAKPKPQAQHVLIHCYGGHSISLPLEALMSEDVLLAHHLNGQELKTPQGWPVRLVVPSRYAWKSAKWVKGLELLAECKLGYWEERGYHHNADPWKGERYS